jgi:D-sedoheptulose 7-phosphate isomerase
LETSQKLAAFVSGYTDKLNGILASIDIAVLQKVIDAMVTAFARGNTVYVIGNGGSAATASHMQADFSFFVRYFTQFRPRIFALTDNVPMITAIGNDTSFDTIFVEQLKGRFISGDVLIAISASGNSPNLVNATAYVNQSGGTSIAFVGFEGGKLNELAQIALHTPNPKGDYGPIEDVHMILNHIIVNYLSTHPAFLAIPPSH